MIKKLNNLKDVMSLQSRDEVVAVRNTPGFKLEYTTYGKVRDVSTIDSRDVLILDNYSLIRSPIDPLTHSEECFFGHMENSPTREVGYNAQINLHEFLNEVDIYLTEK